MKGSVRSLRKEGGGRDVKREKISHVGNAGGPWSLLPSSYSPNPPLLHGDDVRNFKVGNTVRSGNGGGAPASAESKAFEGGKVGSPVKTTPKLERHFSFESEVERSISPSEVGNPGKSVEPVPRGKPVKPRRKNIPKVGNAESPPCLKKSIAVPTCGFGLNSIFGDNKEVSLSAVNRKPVKIGAERESGNGAKAFEGTGTFETRDKTGSTDSPDRFSRSDSSVTGRIDTGGAVGRDQFPEEPSSARGWRATPEAIGRDVVRVGSAAAPPSNPPSFEHESAPWRPLTLSESGSPARLVSQDSGVDTRDNNGEGFPSRTMLLDDGTPGGRGSEDPPRRRCQISREKLCGEFGDVSEDIGLDKLAGLYCGELESSDPPSHHPPNPDDDDGCLTFRALDFPECNYGGEFKLAGEFGDVTEDLGAGRFPSALSEGRAGQWGQPYGVYESLEVRGNGGVLEEVVEGLVGNPVGDFPGLSADSGMDADDWDDYQYDEDYATCVEGGPNLDEELILEVLCANRVSQMTRTYNDIEAVSRLLEEKEKDLELTARIGKELLDQNQGLKVRLAALEVEIRSAHEGNTQLKHELQQKSQLLHALTSDEDGSPHDHPSPLMSPTSANLPTIPSSLIGPLGGKSGARAGVELLKRRVAWLEDENKSLRVEAGQLARETQRVEEEEAKLVEGVAQQLASVSQESRMLSEELERVRNEGGRQREEVDTLLEKLDSSEEEIRRLRQENEELSSLVMITRENQDRLTTELADFKERYGEVMCLLTEAQESLRKMRQKDLPSALSGNRYLIPPITTHHSLQHHFGDSIASELESSLNSELSLDSGIHMPEGQGRVPHYRKVFETVRSASRSSNSPSPSPLHRLPSTASLHGTSSSFAQLSTTATLSSSSMQTCRVSARPAVSSGTTTGSAGYRNSFSSDAPRHIYGGFPNAGFHSLDSAGQSEESDQSGMATDSEDCLYPGNSNTRGAIRDGIPGSPGAKELQAALVRIAKQQQPTLTKGEKAIGGYEGKSTGSSTDVGPHRWSMSSSSSVASASHALPYGCRTPDSIMSTGSSRGSSRSTWRMPEKLQIVKPLEGSLTLGWWSRLATPSLSAALEERPGVKVRGGVNDNIQQHTLMDLEEDDSVSVSSTKSASKGTAPIHPGKFFQGTASVYTYTNSTVLHPDNVSCVAPSPMPQSPAPSTPTLPTPLISRRSSVSAATPTFSTALGLAKMLHERGISASSSENDLSSSQAHFTSATATPCNSPDETPFSSRSPSPDREDEMDANPIASLISSGAELLRRSLGGSVTVPGPQRAARGRSMKRHNRPPIGSLSRSDRKALAGMKLVEKLERIGLESIMSYSQPIMPFQGLVPLTTTLQVGTMYARPAVKSPMAQLTSLKSTLRSRSTEGQEEEIEGPSPAKQRSKPHRRQDLGTVPTTTKKAQSDPLPPLHAGPGSARGTISAIFFGRKGGLM